jgi:hypothetical protein
MLAGNRAVYGGGAWLSSHSSFVALPTSIVEFIENKAVEGGALGAQDSLLTLSAKWSFFSGNSAEYIGGGIILNNCTVQLLGNCTILNSFSGSDAGGIFVYASFVFVGREATVTFRHNSAVGAGGGASILVSTVSFNGSVTFEG